MNSVTFSAMTAAVTSARTLPPRLAPQASAPAPSADSTVVTMTLGPPKASSSRLRTGT